MTALLERHIRTERGITVTVYELVMAACGKPTSTVEMQPKTANDFLQRHGLRVMTDIGGLVLSNSSQELRRLMQGTGFEADLKGVMSRVPGAHKNADKTVRFNGQAARVIVLPLEPIVGALPVPGSKDDRPF